MYPVSGEAFLTWLGEDSNLSYLRKILMEERNPSDPVMGRHKILMTEECMSLRFPRDIVVRSNAYFFEDKDGTVRARVIHLLKQKLLFPIGPPPSIANRVDLFDWYRTPHAQEYCGLVLIPEASIRWIQT